MKLILETKRLILREFDPSDAQAMFDLNDDPEVLKYTIDVRFESVESARKFLSEYPEYKKRGYGRWAVTLKSDGRFIGWCGLKFNEEQFVDLGFRFFRNVWNNGYATEAASACLDYGFNQLRMTEIIGRALSGNKASIRVLEKIGMQFWKLDVCDGVEDCVYYRRTTGQ